MDDLEENITKRREEEWVGKEKEAKSSYFYEATCLVQLVLNLAAFANFNHLQKDTQF